MSKSNPLAGLIGHYDESDDSDEEMSKSSKMRDDVDYDPTGATIKSKVEVTPQQPIYKPIVEASLPAVPHVTAIPYCAWSACYDESSGYTYYWNQKTNAVTWEPPPEYLQSIKLAQQVTEPKATEVSPEEWQLYQQALAEKQNRNKAKTQSSKMTHPVGVQDSKNIRNGNITKRRASDDSDDEKIELITSYSGADSDSNDDSPKPKSPSPPKLTKASKRQKVQKAAKVEYGPSLPPNQEYSVPIGPTIPEDMIKIISEQSQITSSPKPSEIDDDDSLLRKLRDKTKLLEKLGGEIPDELQELIKTEENKSATEATVNTSIDDFLAEIEQKELPKVKAKQDIDDEASRSPKLLFPSSKHVLDNPIENQEPKTNDSTDKKENYLATTEKNKKKLKINNKVIQDRISEVPTYTTKYSQSVDGNTERTGLGFSKLSQEEEDSPKNTISYGKGLVFTKGETLNEIVPKDTTFDDTIDLLEAKLKFLTEQQMYPLTPVLQMTVQLQTLVTAYRASALLGSYLGRWLTEADSSLLSLEATAAPQGWRCRFKRSEGRYEYQRESDGFTQYEYPAAENDDMDISTTPPHPGIEDKVPMPVEIPPSPVAPPPPPSWDPPPAPGCDDKKNKANAVTETKKEIGDELMSFYNDIAEIESVSTPPLPPSIGNSPERIEVAPPLPTVAPPVEEVKPKKKTKVKISSTVGLKHKAVSSLVAKWQQVAEEINSD